MKNSKTIIAFLLGLLALTACHKDKEFDVKDAVVSNEEMTVSGTHARFSWSVDFAGKFQTGVEVSQSENMTEARRVEATKEEDKFVAIVDSLSMGKKYYYRIVVWNKFGSHEQPVSDFTTSMSYTILVSADEGGSVTGGGTYIAGDTCTVVATANMGYNFVNWTENGSQISTEAEYKFTVTNDRNLVAHFTSQEFTITATAEPEEGGTVDGSGGYNNGDECTLTATPNEGYTFINWIKDGTEVSTNPVCTFTVTETATYVAHFQIQSYTITVSANPAEGGSVEGDGTYEYGQNCTVRATEANGYHFVNWTENGEQVSSDEEYTFTVTRDRDLLANFTLQDYIIHVDIDPENSGTVTGAQGYNYDDECTLKAIPAEGFSFVKWTEGDHDILDNPYIFRVTESRNFVAHFQAINYQISVLAEPEVGGAVTGGGNDFHYGDECTVMATASSNYTFTNWTEGGNVVSSDASYQFAVTGDCTLVANFEQSYPIGAINGLFTINDNGDQVYFSQGNLQYQASTNTWRFAENQWDYVGTQTPDNWGNVGGTVEGSDNNDVSETYSGWIDLFGWGTSGWNSGNTYYQPWDTTDVGNLYGPPGRYDLTGIYDHCDWGVNNQILNGDSFGAWRTLSKTSGGIIGEWDYIIHHRYTQSGIRYAKAIVNGVNGLILLPDVWNADLFILNDYNNIQSDFNSNIITATQWTTLEDGGAVFLPGAGLRVGSTTQDVNDDGSYWSISNDLGDYGNGSALCQGFNRGMIGNGAARRSLALSVRLVCPAN